jgi:fructose-bisphosphate aldolase, class I
MFALIHDMRSRIITAPNFNGDEVIGAILFEKTMDGETEGKPVPSLLWGRGVVPFVKVDTGLEAESDGVQMMKPMPQLHSLLERAKAKRVFGTKMRSVINRASQTGIAAIVRQQFEVAGQILDQDLMPIIEPEVNIRSAGRVECDAILLEEIQKQLNSVPADRKVILKLSIPAEPNLYLPLVDHPRVACVVALSGGFSRVEACAELAKNQGVIASFSRAFLEGLRFSMTDEEFDQSLDRSINQIYLASTVKFESD